MWWWADAPNVPVEEYVAKRYGVMCTVPECFHHQKSHFAIFEPHTLITHYFECDMCGCQRFEPLSPLEICLLIEEELEERNKSEQAKKEKV